MPVELGGRSASERSRAAPHRPRRILQVVESFDGQAIESWLSRLVRSWRNRGIDDEITFYCTERSPGRFADVVRDLGCIVRCSPHSLGSTVAFVRALADELRSGSYDILHCHHDVMSALELWASRSIVLRKRILHVHNTALSIASDSWLKVAVGREPMRRYCCRVADNIVGVSSAARETFLRGALPRPGRDVVIHCGIDTSRFHFSEESRAAARQRLGLSTDARVLLHIGRLTEYKNPLFSVAVADQMRAEAGFTVLVVAGTGPLQADVLEAGSRREQGAVRVVGWQDDVAGLMHAADALLWPSIESPMEGLGLGVVEAQAAGLPVLVSHAVPTDAEIVPGLVHRVPLAARPSGWADVVHRIVAATLPSRQACAATVAVSTFSDDACAAAILRLYARADSEQPNGVSP